MQAESRPPAKVLIRQAGLLGCILLMCGCTITASRFTGFTAHERATFITAFPPILQDKSISCGPACLIAVMGYWQQPLSAFADKIYRKPLARSYSAQDLAELARSAGLKSFVYRGSLDDLETN